VDVYSRVMMSTNGPWAELNSSQIMYMITWKEQQMQKQSMLLEDLLAGEAICWLALLEVQ